MWRETNIFLFIDFPADISRSVLGVPWDLIFFLARFASKICPPPHYLILWEMYHLNINFAFKSHTIQNQKQGISKAPRGGGALTILQITHGGSEMSLPPPLRYASAWNPCISQLLIFPLVCSTSFLQPFQLSLPSPVLYDGQLYLTNFFFINLSALKRIAKSLKSNGLGLPPSPNPLVRQCPYISLMTVCWKLFLSASLIIMET